MIRYLSAVAVLAAGLSAGTPGAWTGAAWAADLVRVSDGPFISGGAFYVARDLGYFGKLGITIETKYFDDGSLAVPSAVAGELDIVAMTPSASLFNSVAKGAPLVVILDRGRNHPGRAYTVTSVTQALYDQGVHSLADFARLKGKKIGVGAIASINQFNVVEGLVKAGLDPATDVQWVVNVPQPDLMKMLGQGQVDATDIAYQFGVFAQDNKWGPIVATGDEVSPDAQLAAYAARQDFLKEHRDVAVRFVMAYLHGTAEFNAAAGDPEKYPEIVALLAKDTALNKPALVERIAPHWSYVDPDGVPNVASIMEMQDVWGGRYFHYVANKVSRDQLFDLSIVKEAKARLEREKPFGG